MKRRYLFLALVMLIVGSAAAVAWVLTQRSSVQISAWLPGDAGDEGIQSFTAHINTLDEINLFWYAMTSNGRVNTLPGAENQSLLDAARRADLRIVPTVINSFDPGRVAAVISEPERRAAHVETLVQLAQTHGYDGIEIDYEGLYAESRDDFSAFIAELAVALHRKHKILAIAVHPKTGPEGTWSGAQAQDWERLGAAVDEFKVMTYDYHWGASEAGPISPPDWIDEVLTYAEKAVPSRKVWMGIPFYGYVWQGKTGLGLTWSEMERRAQLYGAQPQRDEASSEMTFTYTTAQDETFSAYYNDAASIAAKLDVLLTHHPDIAGVCIWRLGGEDPQVWETLAHSLAQNSPATNKDGRNDR